MIKGGGYFIEHGTKQPTLFSRKDKSEYFEETLKQYIGHVEFLTFDLKEFKEKYSLYLIVSLPITKDDFKSNNLKVIIVLSIICLISITSLIIFKYSGISFDLGNNSSVFKTDNAQFEIEKYKDNLKKLSESDAYPLIDKLVEAKIVGNAVVELYSTNHENVYNLYVLNNTNYAFSGNIVFYDENNNIISTTEILYVKPFTIDYNEIKTDKAMNDYALNKVSYLKLSDNKENINFKGGFYNIDDNSDFDIIIISDKKDLNLDNIKEFSKKMYNYNKIDYYQLYLEEQLVYFYDDEDVSLEDIYLKYGSFNKAFPLDLKKYYSRINVITKKIYIYSCDGQEEVLELEIDVD